VDSSDATPGLDRLDAASVEAVHEASMHVIAEVGIQLTHERARAVVEDAGGRVDDDGVATLPRGLLTDAVDRAPDAFTLHARDPEKDVTVGDGPPVRAPAYGPSTVHTFDGGSGDRDRHVAGSAGAANYERRDARLADYERLVKLAHAEEVITCAGYSLCEPTDVPRADRHLAMLERSLTLTDKPVMGPTRGGERARACMDMVEIAFADRAGVAFEAGERSDPVVAGLVNTTPPRSIDGAMLGGLLTYADHGQPLVVSSFTMAGASGPPTLAASLVQANAETLAFVALAQLVNPGTPVVYGVPSATIDDRYGSLSIGGPESALFVALAGQLARHYGLPCRAGGALSDAKTVDYQGGLESGLLGAVTAFGGVDLALNAAGVLESYAAVSPEKFVLDCELLRSLARFRQGVTVDEGTLALDRIADADPAGHFLEEDEASASFHRPAVLDKRAHDDWTADRSSAFELGRDRVDALLESYERPPMDPGVERDLRAYVADRSTV
jgi:trimethylamine--corrinoid protein Co-methyltransferase